MNKQLIKDNKEVFNHWLDDGKVLFCYPDIKDETRVWHCIENSTWYINQFKVALVINDEYVYFRKAEAEGKTIQKGWNLGTPEERWDDLAQFPNKPTMLHHYRIKPDEPKFKVGDWVKCEELGMPPFVLSKENIGGCLQFPIRLWKPQTDEWCWFYSGNTVIPSLRKFIAIGGDGGRVMYKAFETFYQDSEKPYINCEPFLGTLPTNLKSVQ